MKPHYGEACKGCVCIACVEAFNTEHPCACCRPCFDAGYALITKTCTGFEGWPAC